jgi:nitric oxide reductase NorD protein
VGPGLVWDLARIAGAAARGLPQSTRHDYRKGWCQLRERDVHPQLDHYVLQTRHKYRGLLKHPYRTFEALRGEDKLLKGEPFGDDPDIDAIVEA